MGNFTKMGNFISNNITALDMSRVSYKTAKVFPEPCKEIHLNFFTKEAIINGVINCDECQFTNVNINIIRRIIDYHTDIILSKHHAIVIHTNMEPILRIINNNKLVEKTDRNKDLQMGIVIQS